MKSARQATTVSSKHMTNYDVEMLTNVFGKVNKVLQDISLNLATYDELVAMALAIDVTPPSHASFKSKFAVQHIHEDAWQMLYEWWEAQLDNGVHALFEALCAADRVDIALQFQNKLMVRWINSTLELSLLPLYSDKNSTIYKEG